MNKGRMMTPLEEGRLMRLLFVLAVLALSACAEAPSPIRKRWAKL